MKTKLFFLSIAVILMTSCSDSNPIGDFIEGSWEFESYSRNGMDETASVLISNYTETYAEGAYSRTYIDGKQEEVDESGEYQINEEEMALQISNVSSISDFSNEHSTLSASRYDVITINDTVLVYSFENGGDTHQFEFVRK